MAISGRFLNPFGPSFPHANDMFLITVPSDIRLDSAV